MLILPTPDVHDFSTSPFFDPDPESGLGGWGDPQDDFQITTGAFAFDFERPYPTPHRIRRNYTAMSDGAPSVTEPLNTLFTPERIETMVDGFPGDFVGFQKQFEGSDGAIHQIVGGCVAMDCPLPLFLILTSADSDLSGLCPSSAGLKCRGGPKWTPNGSFYVVSVRP